MDEAVTVGHSRNAGCTLPILRLKLGNQEQRCEKDPNTVVYTVANQPNGRTPPAGSVPVTPTPHAKGRAEERAEVAAEASGECSLGVERRRAWASPWQGDSHICTSFTAKFRSPLLRCPDREVHQFLRRGPMRSAGHESVADTAEKSRKCGPGARCCSGG